MKKNILILLLIFNKIYSQKIKGIGKCMTYRDGIELSECKEIALKNAKKDLLLKNYALKITNKSVLDSINNLLFSDEKSFLISYVIDSTDEKIINIKCKVSVSDTKNIDNLLNELKKDTNIFEIDSIEIKNQFKYSLLLGFGFNVLKFDNISTNSVSYEFPLNVSFDFDVRGYVNENSEFVASIGITPFYILKNKFNLGYNNLVGDNTIVNVSHIFTTKFLYSYKGYYFGLQISFIGYDINKNQVEEKLISNLDLSLRKYFLNENLVLDTNIHLFKLFYYHYDTEINVTPIFSFNLKYNLNF